MIENDKTRSKQTAFLNLTLFVSEAVSTVYDSTKFSGVLFTAINFTSTFKSIDFNKLTCAKIRKVYGYKNHHAKRGVVVTYYRCEGVGYLSVASWSGAIATGKADSEK